MVKVKKSALLLKKRITGIVRRSKTMEYQGSTAPSKVSSNATLKPSDPAIPPTPAQQVTPQPSTSLKTDMIPGCCGLKTIRVLRCLGAEDALSKKHAEAFDDLVKKGTAEAGNWNTYGKAYDTIAIITDSPSYNKPEQFQRQVKFLTEHGFHEICSWKSYEGSARQPSRNYMYGNSGIKNTEAK